MRDEQRWYDSVAETTYPISFLVPQWIMRMIPPLYRFNRMIIASIWDGVFGSRFVDREHALSIYREHIAHVKAAARPDKLLVFEGMAGSRCAGS